MEGVKEPTERTSTTTAPLLLIQQQTHTRKLISDLRPNPWSTNIVVGVKVIYKTRGGVVGAGPEVKHSIKRLREISDAS